MLPHENAIMSMILAGSDDPLRVLRTQLLHSEVASRKFTGCGFFTHFRVADHAARLLPAVDLVIDDVHAEVREVEHGAGFILFVRSGAISCLEGFTYGESWPENPELLRLYMRHADANSPQLVECKDRNLAWTGRI